MAGPSRKQMLRFLGQLGAFILTRFGFWNCFSMLMLFAERADSKRKPDIHVPYLYIDMGVAVLCASFMSFGVKRRWFAVAAAMQLAISTYASYIGEQVHYGDWLKVRMYSRALAIIGGFLVLASGAGEVYRQKARSRSMQSTGQVFLGIYLICMVYSLRHSNEDRQAYLNHIAGDPDHHPSPGHPAHRRKPRILAQQPQGGVLEPDEADRPQRGDFRRRPHPGHRRVELSGF
uniref:Transmembrane protein 101 n=1 Tax=Poecilia reticulata TaxID=8081 RepID=A0A3P9NZW0_POERE